MTYIEKIINDVKKNNPYEPEFHQAVTEILTSLEPVINANPDFEKKVY